MNIPVYILTDALAKLPVSPERGTEFEVYCYGVLSLTETHAYLLKFEWNLDVNGWVLKSISH